jgi:ubiquinol oxidase
MTSLLLALKSPNILLGIKNNIIHTHGSTKMNMFQNSLLRATTTTKFNYQFSRNIVSKSPSFIQNDKDVSEHHHKMNTKKNPYYAWVDEEAKTLIAKAYQLHQPDKPFPPSVNLTSQDLEKLGTVPHYEPKFFADRVALMSARVLEKFMGLFFREKYDHHAVTLETVAAVPGFVSAMHRHMRSLRRMQRDGGWIDPLLEESLNERMHLLIFMQHVQPTLIERLFVLAAQGAYVSFYSILYAISPRTAHRAVGYLEEAAHRAYNEYLESLHNGKLPNPVLPEDSIGLKFYRLPVGSRLRDVVLRIRADEAYHALYNHGLGDILNQKDGADKIPYSIEDDIPKSVLYPTTTTSSSNSNSNSNNNKNEKR